jgi:hypothetical protein
MSTTGTNAIAFTLPPAYRPTTTVYVKVDLCGADNGRLVIDTDGVTTVQAESAFSDAQCFTSLDGATYAVKTLTRPLTLENGWYQYGGSAVPAAEDFGGIVRLQGAIATSGTNALAFRLPIALRPAAEVFIPVDMCDATNGRLWIETNGNVTVYAEGDTFSNAQCFTSLDGAWFSISGLTTLTLKNGWTTYVGGNVASVENIDGVVTFAGGMSTTGTDATAFTLPLALRPSADVFIPVNLCASVGGRIQIDTNGEVTVQVESTGTFASAQCFTSLDGASFVL